MPLCILDFQLSVAASSVDTTYNRGSMFPQPFEEWLRFGTKLRIIAMSGTHLSGTRLVRHSKGSHGAMVLTSHVAIAPLAMAHQYEHLHPTRGPAA